MIIIGMLFLRFSLCTSLFFGEVKNK